MLLDTCIVIDVLREKQAAIAFIAALDGPPRLSAVSVTEIYGGMRHERERRDIERFIAASIIIGFDFEVARLAGDYVRRFKASHSVDSMDAMIAATAAHRDLPLATLNLKHFPMFKGLTRPY